MRLCKHNTTLTATDKSEELRISGGWEQELLRIYFLLGVSEASAMKNK